MQKLQVEIDELIAAQARLGGQWLLVSNEVGLGLVPPYPLGRVYRDALGWANQALARAAERVIFMVAGIPMAVK
jgi:adenosylcobinamide kinase/adenosylcobinamide-phosphate guanylyltransferase